MEIKNTAIDTIKPYEKNPRKNEKAIEKVAESLSEFGWQQPIVVDEDFIVLAGHTRLSAAKALGFSEVPVYVAKGLSEAQKKSYRIADNKTSEYAEWDKDLLTLTAFSLDEIAKFSDDFLDWEDSEENEEEEIDHDDLLKDLNSAHVKMVLLYLNTETEPVFREMSEKLQEHFGTENLSDTIFKVVEDAHKNI